MSNGVAFETLEAFESSNDKLDSIRVAIRIADEPKSS